MNLMQYLRELKGAKEDEVIIEGPESSPSVYINKETLRFTTKKGMPVKGRASEKRGHKWISGHQGKKTWFD